jgi:chorismate lyase/3-hydroxybenzoate synthase
MLRNFLSTTPEPELLCDPNTLAVLRYGGRREGQTHTMHIAPLPETDAVEVWQVDDVVSSGVDGNCYWRRSTDFQFTSISLPLPATGDFQSVASQAYDELLKNLVSSPQAHPLRFWNYLPAINMGEGDNENYKQFCRGRLAAFTRHAITDQDFPSASAVGHHQSGLTICALSTHKPTRHHANPRQVDAFEYPREYGPASPSFARATTLSLDNNRLCFISGTASILGHSSVHQGDLRLQLYTTNDNILYLLEETDFEPHHIQTARIYLRDKHHYQECKEIVERSYPDIDLVFAEADICRHDLLVEIECFCIAD